MKKLLAALALFVMAGLAAYAGDTWTDTKQGTVTATVYCVAKLVGPTTSLTLGNFFTGTEENTVSGTLTWNLYGPKSPASYSVTATTIPSGGLQNDEANGAYLKSSWSSYCNTNIQSSNMTCYGAQNQASFDIVFTVSKLIAGSSSGEKHWTLTVKVDSSI